MAEVYVEKLKIKKVVRQKDYQEVFFTKRRVVGGRSISIRGCQSDIASLLKTSFFGCRSEMEIHSLLGFPIKLYLDGVLLAELTEQEYPKTLTERLKKEAEDNQKFADLLVNFWKNYPLKPHLETAVYALPQVWLRAYAGAIIWKAKEQGKLEDELYQRRCSMMLDILKAVGILGESSEFVERWGVWLAEEGFLTLSDDTRIMQALKQVSLEPVPGYEMLIGIYVDCLLRALHWTYNEDVLAMKSYLFQQYGMFSDRTIDKSLLIDFCDRLTLYRPSKQVPNFIIEDQPAMEEIRYYLSTQNW